MLGIPELNGCWLVAAGVASIVAQGQRRFEAAAGEGGPLGWAEELPESLAAKAVELAGQGKKIEAIKLVREQMGWDLRQAKEAVEQLAYSHLAPGDHWPTQAPGELSPDVLSQAQELIANRRAVEAVTLIRQATGWSLADAKAYVDRMRPYRPE